MGIEEKLKAENISLRGTVNRQRKEIRRLLDAEKENVVIFHKMNEHLQRLGPSAARLQRHNRLVAQMQDHIDRLIVENKLISDEEYGPNHEVNKENAALRRRLISLEKENFELKNKMMTPRTVYKKPDHIVVYQENLSDTKKKSFFDKLTGWVTK